MATIFKNKVVKDVGTVPILAIEVSNNAKTTIVGLSLTNLLENIVYASVLVHDDTSVEGYYLKDVMVPPNTSLRAVTNGEKLILASNNQLYLVADEENALDVIVSYVDII